MKAWILAPAAFSLALCSAEDCPSGSCATPRTSLLQLKSLSQTRESLAAGSSSSTSAALAGFQKFTDEMITKYGRGDTDDKSLAANASELGAVNTILDFLKEMQTTFRKAHLDAKQRGDECYSEAYHTHCPFSWTQYHEFEDQWRESIHDHWSCRRDAKESCEHETYWCEEYDHYRIEETKSKLPQCIRNGAFADEVLAAGGGSNQLNTPLHPETNCQSGYSHNASPYAGCFIGEHAGKDPLQMSPAESEVICQDNLFSESGPTQKAQSCKSQIEARLEIWKDILECGEANPSSANGFSWSKTTLSVARNSYDALPLQLAQSSSQASSASLTVWPSTAGAEDLKYAPYCYAVSWGGSQSCFFREFVRTNTAGHATASLSSDFGDRAGEVTEFDDAIYSGIAQNTPFVWTYGEWMGDGSTGPPGGLDLWRHVDKCKSRVWGRAIAKDQGFFSTSPQWANDWENTKTAADDDTIASVLRDIGLWDSGASNSANCAALGATATETQIEAALPESKTLEQCYCAEVVDLGQLPLTTPACNNANDYSGSGDGSKDLCWYGEAKKDLYSAFAGMTGADSLCGGVHGTWMKSAAYIDGGHAVLKLKAFEDCLDVTFDWLYGESDVAAEQINYITRSTDNDRHYATGQYHYSLGGKGRAALNSLYAHNDNGFVENHYFDKLNGLWKDASSNIIPLPDMVVPTTVQYTNTNNGGTDVTNSRAYTKQYTGLKWSRRGWSTATEAWSTSLFHSSSSTWGLWQHYVHCELSESRRKEHLLDQEGDGKDTDCEDVDGEIRCKRDYLDRLDQNTIGLAKVDQTRGAWGSEQRHQKYDPNAGHEAVLLWNQSDYDDYHSVGRSHHCSSVYEGQNVLDQHCNGDDGSTGHRHLRCWDYYTMCTALQERSESSYQEWKTFREDECDIQEKCLTGFGVAVMEGTVPLSQVDTDGEQDHQNVRQLIKNGQDSRLALCSETCAIEHENALAREADHETAERLKCMLVVLFGKLNDDTTWSGSTSASGIAVGDTGCTENAQCAAELECNADGTCVDITSVWNYTMKDDRRSGLQTCSSPATWQINGEYKYKDSWTLHQIECPSWTAGQATKNWWETNDNTLAAYQALAASHPARADQFEGIIPAGPVALASLEEDGVTHDPDSAGSRPVVVDGTNPPGLLATVPASAANEQSLPDAVKCLTRKGCGFDAGVGCTDDDQAICHIMCDARRSGGCAEADWKLEFLHSKWWNTHDVCHLDWADHKGTLDSIKTARTEDKTGSTEPKWQTTTTWGKTRENGVMDYCARSDTGVGESDPVEFEKTLRHALYDANWLNQANNELIFQYMGSDFMKTWQKFHNDDADDSITKYCSPDTSDSTETPNTGATATLKGWTRDDNGNWVVTDEQRPAQKLHCWKQRATHMIVNDEWSGDACTPDSPNWVNNPAAGNTPDPLSAR